MTKGDSSLTRDIAPFGVRMSPELKERVSLAAKANNRSMNAEIVATLEAAYPSDRWDQLTAQIMKAVTERAPREVFADDLEEQIRKKLDELLGPSTSD
jgi:predicted transcriptional regulator